MATARVPAAGVPIALPRVPTARVLVVLLGVLITAAGVKLSSMVMSSRMMLMTLVPLLVFRLVLPGVKFSSHVGLVVARGIVPIVKSRIVV